MTHDIASFACLIYSSKWRKSDFAQRGNTHNKRFAGFAQCPKLAGLNLRLRTMALPPLHPKLAQACFTFLLCLPSFPFPQSPFLDLLQALLSSLLEVETLQRDLAAPPPTDAQHQPFWGTKSCLQLPAHGPAAGRQAKPAGQGWAPSWGGKPTGMTEQERSCLSHVCTAVFLNLFLH